MTTAMLSLWSTSSLSNWPRVMRGLFFRDTAATTAWGPNQPFKSLDDRAESP